MPGFVQALVIKNSVKFRRFCRHLCAPATAGRGEIAAVPLLHNSEFRRLEGRVVESHAVAAGNYVPGYFAKPFRGCWNALGKVTCVLPVLLFHFLFVDVTMLA